ncbi:MAG: response regulator transcription factor [Lachnospiraceae bacterium]|jgi:DNA-binding response OmpR family regulator|nr:response regulator transcription factor [Lachnospiraceae bacterium]
MRILLAEDDKKLNESLTNQLISRGFNVDFCYDGEEAFYYAAQNIHDVILLDRMLPNMEGTMVLTKLRKQGINIPIILITALGTLNDKVTGLNLGADDYLVKPFAFEELLARIQCVTRRSPIINQAILPSYCDIRFDGTSNTLTGPAGSCTCSKREGAMLETFIKNGGQTLSRNTLLLKVWGPDSDVEEGNLDNYIYFVRRRLKAVGSCLKLRTIRGIGYCLLEE